MSIYAKYNEMHNSLEIKWTGKTIIIIDCNKAEDWLRISPGEQYDLNALAIDNSLQYAVMTLEGSMQN